MKHHTATKRLGFEPGHKGDAGVVGRVCDNARLDRVGTSSDLLDPPFVHGQQRRRRTFPSSAD